VTKFNILNPAAAINTPFRIQRAFDAAQGAAFTLAGLNALTSVLMYFEEGRVSTFVGDDPRQVWLAHVAAAVLAFLIGVTTRARSAGWACWLILVWAILENIPWVTANLYAHVGVLPLRVFILFLAIQGVRGVLARRKLQKAAGKVEAG
jgi:hypothetical protein